MSSNQGLARGSVKLVRSKVQHKCTRWNCCLRLSPLLLAGVNGESIATLYRLKAIDPGMTPAVKRLSSFPFESRIATSPGCT